MEEDLLRAALDRLDLAPGASWTEILARYRRLARAWHPDRFINPKDKISAEEKLKKIIAAKELLQAHYQSNQHHLFARCICWGKESTEQPAHTGTGQTATTGAQQTAGQQAAQTANATGQTASRTAETNFSKANHTTPAGKSPPRRPPPARGGARAAKDTPLDWRDALSQYLDMGPLTPKEPGWLEPFLRLSEKITGKHPGETIEDIWDKPASWTKERKRQCLLMTLFAVMAFDKCAACTPNTTGDAEERPAQTSTPEPPAQTSAPELPSQISTPDLSAQTSTPEPPAQSPPSINYTPPGSALDAAREKAEELRREQQYFEEKWHARERMLQPISPGKQASN